jgi:hypothetical protein
MTDLASPGCEPESSYLSGWGWQIVGALAGLLAVSFIVNWSLASFYGVDIFASIAFPGNDSSWCDTTKYAFGRHCWSDYTLIRFDSLTAVPAKYMSATVGVEQTYPVSTRIVRIPFFVVEQVLGFKAGLLAFIAAITACLAAPAWWATIGARWPQRVMFLLVGTVATAPFLVVWDRGNIFAFVVPLLLVALVAIVVEKPWIAVLAIIAAASVKPQYAGMGLALLALRLWIPGIIALAGAAAAMFLPFLLLGGSALSGATDWLRTAALLNERLPLTVDLPQNISFARLLARAVEVTAQVGELVGLDMLQVRVLLGAPLQTYTTISLVFSASIIALLLVVGRRLDRSVLAIAFAAVLSLSTTLTYAYYFAFCIPALAILVRAPRGRFVPHGRLQEGLKLVLSAAIVCALTPLVIPMRAVNVIEGPLLVGSWLPLLGTGFFALFLILAVAVGLQETLRSPRPWNQSGCSS